MSLRPEARASLFDFLQTILPHRLNYKARKDKAAKSEQILAYLEIMHAQLRKYSRKQDLVLVDAGAGNCYLSFLLYYFYADLDARSVTIHCLDTNARLMVKARKLATSLGFGGMHFHASDIAGYEHQGRVDVVYSLHACDSATDESLYFGLRNRARCIYSVACCQHTVKRHLRGHPYTGITKHRVFKDKIAYMVGDALRALLLEMQGYEVDIFEFVSSRSTDKNTMMRARIGNQRNADTLRAEYAAMKDAFRVTPPLETYLNRDREMSTLSRR